MAVSFRTFIMFCTWPDRRRLFAFPAIYIFYVQKSCTFDLRANETFATYRNESIYICFSAALIEMYLFNTITVECRLDIFSLFIVKLQPYSPDVIHSVRCLFKHRHTASY